MPGRSWVNGRKRVINHGFIVHFQMTSQKCYSDGKRVAALIEIDAKEYPQGFVKCSAGTPNCKCIIGEDTIDLIKLGKTIVCL